MLHYLYHFDYDTSGSTPAIVLHVRVLAIAHKYLIAPLKKLAADKFAERCKEEWNTVAFADAVREMYSKASIPDPLSPQTAINAASEHSKELRTGSAEASAAFKAVVLGHPQLEADLFFVGETKREYKCPLCSSIFSYNQSEEHELQLPTIMP